MGLFTAGPLCKAWDRGLPAVPRLSANRSAPCGGAARRVWAQCREATLCCPRVPCQGWGWSVARKSPQMVLRAKASLPRKGTGPAGTFNPSDPLKAIRRSGQDSRRIDTARLLFSHERLHHGHLSAACSLDQRRSSLPVTSVGISTSRDQQLNHIDSPISGRAEERGSS
jgi:hypothetical protein